MKNLFISYSDAYLAWQLGAGDGSHPTNPVRAKLATEMLAESLGTEAIVIDPMPEQERDSWIEAVKSIHDAKYVDEVMAGDSGEWYGNHPDVAAAGLAMFAGTGRLVRKVIDGEATVVFNPQGAKHHAQRHFGSGFCVFNDMVYAAKQLKAAGLRPLYIDWDIHAGDGVWEMLKGESVPVISIHCATGYPGNPEMQTMSVAEDLIHEDALGYNFNMPIGANDDLFKAAIDKSREIIDGYQPDVILLAAGADGNGGPSRLGQLASYTTEGFAYAANMIAEMANKHSEGRVIIGGAGGYQPLKETPEIWALVVEKIYREVAEFQQTKKAKVDNHD